MPTIKKGLNTKLTHGNPIVDEIATDHSTDPFVVKKVEEAKVFLKKNGFPNITVKK